jgi:nucleolar protein 15
MLLLDSSLLQAKPASKSTPKPSTHERGVVYLGHLPFGFFEESMRSFFTQFGDIRACKLSRSKKTARSKGYAFIEFEDLPTARIVAESMNGYMMFGHTLKAAVVDQEKIHPDLFKGVGETFRKMPWQAIQRAEHNKRRTKSKEAKRIARLNKAENKKRAQLAVLKIEYEFPGYLGEKTARKLQNAAADADEAVAKSPKSPKEAAANSTKKSDQKKQNGGAEKKKDSTEKSEKQAPSQKKTEKADKKQPAPAAAAESKSDKKKDSKESKQQKQQQQKHTPATAEQKKPQPASPAQSKKKVSTKRPASSQETTSPAPAAKKAKAKK